MTLQEGIGWRGDHRPGAFFAMVCLRRRQGTSPAQLHKFLTGLWSTYDDLRRGLDAELRPEPGYAGRLQCLVGYGPRLFDGVEIPKGGEPPAAELRECAFNAPSAPARSSGAGRIPVLPGAALKYDRSLADNGADADVAIQLTAETLPAVTRAVAATQRHANKAEGAVNVSGAWLGYRREDRRSWLGFHDGVANVNGPERANVVVVGPAADDTWLRGGTYLAFLRIEIHLEVWEDLSRAQQQILVGRDRDTGAPLLDAVGDDLTVADLTPGTQTIFARANLSVREPLPVDLDDPSGLGGSHVQRTRRHPNVRIYRQGYEFLDVSDTPPIITTGLNFVSFQAAPSRLTSMLRPHSWLGEQSFAGYHRGGELFAVPDLLSVHAAGMFAVPPATRPSLPGDALFRTLERGT